jgi:uncharacterized protein (TIGR03437 family)
VSAIVPYAVGGRATTQVQLEYLGVRSNVVSMAVAAASPALFTANSSGSGPGAILNQDYSLNTAANGAVKGSPTPVATMGKLQLMCLPVPGWLSALRLVANRPSSITLAPHRDWWLESSS